MTATAAIIADKDLAPLSRARVRAGRIARTVATRPARFLLSSVAP